MKHVLALIVPLLLTGTPAPASAKSQKDLGYTYDVVWSTTVRFLRADRGYKITDKDKDNGFVLFVYPGAGSIKECNASLEMLRTTDDEGRKQIRLQLTIQHQPSYIEVHLLDTLEEKLRDEQGAPPQSAPPAPPPKKEPAPKSPEEKKPEG